MTTPTDLQAEVTALRAEVELYREAAADATVARSLAREDAGWASLTGLEDGVVSRERILDTAKRARIRRLAHPLIRRAVALHTAYVHGQGVTVQAAQEEGAGQDVNAVVQAFLDDDSNVATFTGQQAREELEARFETDGNAFHALPTSPLTGRVQVRTIPFAEVVDIITDPEDAATPWFYKRQYTATIVEPGTLPGTTRTRRETRTVYYPDVRYRPTTRPKNLDGKPVDWFTPVVHTYVNRPDGCKWGTPHLFAALPWADGYAEFLQDWARLVKALSKVAWAATAKTGRGAAKARDALNAAPADLVGATAAMTEGTRLEAVSKSGATIDSDSGRPLAAMVAAGTGLPVTMLLGDPGVTGARATAETLDKPLELDVAGRQRLHTHLMVTVLSYVIDQAVKAPQGQLKGTVTRDKITGREVITLAGDQDRTVTVDWPSVESTPLETLVKAITDADAADLLPPAVLARLLAVALDVDDVDAVMDMLIDDNGAYRRPSELADLAGAMGAVQRGDPVGTTPDPAASTSSGTAPDNPEDPLQQEGS
jgi:hypothetical protein